jgi:flagellar basal-body rod protein FlgC
MSSFSSFDISASGIYAQRTRLDVIANNIANAETTRTPEGGPYRRQKVAFSAVYQNAVNNNTVQAGVKTETTQDPTDFIMVHDPGHPDADANGNVMKPNVNVVEEMVNMVSATRAYEANIAAMNATKAMITQAIDLGK